MPMRVFVGYIFAMEFLPSNKTSFVSAVTLGIDGFAMGFCALWFMVISKNWKSIFTFATILVYITFVLVWTMPESPKFLVTQGRYSEARKVMTKIAEVNKVTQFAFNEEESKVFGVTHNQENSE